jgi:hypothetical protein
MYRDGYQTNFNYNSHMEMDTRQISITTPIWRWIQDKFQLQLPYGGGYKTSFNYNSHMEVDTRQITINVMIRISTGSIMTGFWDW